MSDTIVPLPVYPWPIAPEVLALMKQAKAELDPPYQVQPVPAVPGSPGRVLAIGVLPPHLASVVLVEPAYAGVYEAIREGMRQALMVPAGALRLVDEGDVLGHLLGARDITDALPRDFDGVMDEKAPVAA